MRREGQVKEVAEFIERLSLQFVEMKDLPISRLLNEDSLSNSMFVAHRNIVVKGKFNRRGYPAALHYVSDRNGFPLFLTVLFTQL